MFFLDKKRILVLITTVVSVYLFLWVYSSFFSAKQEKYITATVKRGHLEESVLATGIVKPLRLVAVGARTTGRIISLKVVPGVQVKQGDLLAEIDPTTQQNDLKNKEAALAVGYANLDEQEAMLVAAQQNLARQRAMIKSHAVARADIENAEADVKVRLAQVKALKAQIIQSQIDVEIAQVNLGYTRITAPFDGTVLATVVQEGQNVNAVQSAPTIIILGDLSIMTVQAEISEVDIVKVKLGQDLYFTVLGNPNRRYEAKLATIEPAPSSIRNDISFNSSGCIASSATSAIYYNGTFYVDNADGALHTYMTAEVHIILEQAQNALLLPVDALITKPGSDGFYMVRVLQNNGKIVKKKVKIGINNKVVAEVLSGLDESDTVITGYSSATRTKPQRQLRPW
ncbi:MAG: Efflux transporter MFP subunit [Candidatus Tokpelaia sp. JSC085]|nr:MAG: Efflux transporter MFP subunit [Candidatus Tokpelaia sp. JSC085]